MLPLRVLERVSFGGSVRREGMKGRGEELKEKGERERGAGR